MIFESKQSVEMKDTNFSRISACLITHWDVLYSGKHTSDSESHLIAVSLSPVRTRLAR